MFQAWLTFAIFEIGRRAPPRHRRPTAYRRELGELLAPFSSVAAKNPYAWFPLERTVDELITPSRDNRLVGYPYTKYMVSVMDVDMAAALVIASHEAADELGVPADQRVYLRGWCYGTDPIYVAEHREMWRSPAMARRQPRSAVACGRRRSTTWPTSTSTAASPARWGSRSTRSGCRPTTLAGSRSRVACRSPVVPAATT